MPRTARASVGGVCYHVINRVNPGLAVFVNDDDCRAFLQLTGKACDRLPMRILAFCLMPNHFHMVLLPHGDEDLGVWMQWLLTSHVRRHHRRHESYGRIWQGRFKAFPIQEDSHLLTVLRYVERNPVRAQLAEKAEEWPWSSLGGSDAARAVVLAECPVPRGPGWLDWVNEPEAWSALEEVRDCLKRGRPLGSLRWVRETAARLGLESSLRPRGRPKKAGEQTELIL